MLSIRRSPRCDRRLDERERGMTLIELLVAMGIFVTVIAVFMSGVVAMTKTTARAQGVSEATSSTRKVLDRFDKQVRYSTAINRPGYGALGAYYVEYLMPAQAAGATPICMQWRYDIVAHTLALRSWTTSVTPVPSAWTTIATDVRNDMATAAPFEFTPYSTSSSHQKLEITLDIGTGTQPGALVSTTYVARNTSSTTQTNKDLDHDGQSDDPVCLGGRP